MQTQGPKHDAHLAELCLFTVHRVATRLQRLRTAGGRQPNPVYELFVLGELMVQPLYGYLLHEIVNMILGPFHRLSWGTLYPLIRGLEQEGFITSQVQKRRAGLLQTERGPSRKVYALTETGQTRFLALMLDPGDYNPDYPNLFAMKFTKFGYLTPAQRLAVLEHYRTFLCSSGKPFRGPCFCLCSITLH